MIIEKGNLSTLDTWVRGGDDVEYVDTNKLNEGLILSYSPNSCKKHLMHMFDYVFDVYCSDKYEDRKIDYVPFFTDGEQLSKYFPKFVVAVNQYLPNYDKLNGVVENLCGWKPFVVRLTFHRKQYKTDIRVTLRYDEYVNVYPLGRYGTNDISELVFNYAEICYIAKYSTAVDVKTDYLYHVSGGYEFDKIAKKGLVPRNKKSYEFERIYVADDLCAYDTLVSFDKDALYVLYRIPRRAFDKLYIDEKHPHCYYCLNSVSPDDIEVMTVEKGFVPVKEEVEKDYALETIRHLRTIGFLNKFSTN